MSGTAIRQRRESVGLTQEQLARLAECSTSFVRNVDAGWRPHNNSPAYERIMAALADAEERKAAA